MIICPQKGDETTNLENTKLPDGWDWLDDWQIDLNRAVDEDGRLDGRGGVEGGLRHPSSAPNQR